MTAATMTGRTLALLPWGDAVEDFLDGIGITLGEFCDSMTGGWLFGYVEALRLAGWRCVIICVSRGVQAVQRRRHLPTGATIVLLPQVAAYRRAAEGMDSPYAASPAEAFGTSHGAVTLRQRLAWQLAPYLATPLGPLLRCLRREGATHLLVQEYESARFEAGVLAGRLLGLPVFASFQGGDRHHRRLERLLRPRSLARCAGLVIASGPEAERVQARYGVPAARIARIANPLDLALWHPEDRAASRAALGRPAEETVVICHGRIDLHRKGLDVLVQAWATCCAERPGAALRLVLVGSGSDNAALQALLAQHPQARVEWHQGYILDRATMRRQLGAADAYVMASRHEGFPVAPLEAMACGLPVVATDVPGIPEILGGGEASGGLVVPRGEAAPLAVALGRLLDDAALRQRLGKAARRRVEAKYGFTGIGAALSAVLLGQAAGPRA